ECVRQAVRTGLGLKAQINRRSIFDRKNYFYPDLPQGYQISQYKDPIVGEGKVMLDMGADGEIEIGIERLHLEQDAGKSINVRHRTRGRVDSIASAWAARRSVPNPVPRPPKKRKPNSANHRQTLRNPALGAAT